MRPMIEITVIVFVMCVVAQPDVTSSVSEECRVVNNNYYYGNNKGQSSLEGQTRLKVGLPGKKGPPGEKGSRGEPGVKGGSIITADQKIQLRKQVISEPLPRTCGDLQGYETGFYWIAPDPFVVQPAYVFCNFTMGKAATIIAHDSMDEIQGSNCEAAACYKRTINYGITMKKIMAIIEQSNHCRQFIKWRCNAALLLQSDYSWWESRDGAQMKYWGGATSHRKYFCACGETESCHDNSKKCNCDHNSSPELSDEGYLDDKEVLPVTKLAFGDMGDPGESGYHTLGPLECW